MLLKRQLILFTISSLFTVILYFKNRRKAKFNKFSLLALLPVTLLTAFVLYKVEYVREQTFLLSILLPYAFVTMNIDVQDEDIEGFQSFPMIIAFLFYCLCVEGVFGFTDKIAVSSMYYFMVPMEFLVVMITQFCRKRSERIYSLAAKPIECMLIIFMMISIPTNIETDILAWQNVIISIIVSTYLPFIIGRIYGKYRKFIANKCDECLFYEEPMIVSSYLSLLLFLYMAPKFY